MATDLDKIDEEVLPRARKSVSLAAFAATNLLTTFQQIGPTDKDLNVGNHPSISALLKWTYAAGTTLNLRVKVSHDALTWQWAPSFGSPAAGVSAADILEVTFASATWDIDGVYALLPVEVHLEGWRNAQLFVKSNNASGSVGTASTVGVGTGE